MGRITGFKRYWPTGTLPVWRPATRRCSTSCWTSSKSSSTPTRATLRSRGQEQPAATEERTPTSKAVPGGAKSQGMAALSDEDLGMVKELLWQAYHQVARAWDSTTRTYLT